jgi:hypothetical protein
VIFGRTNIISTSQDAPLYAYCQTGIANGAGSGAGASVTIGVTFATSMAYPNELCCSGAAVPRLPRCNFWKDAGRL